MSEKQIIVFNLNNELCGTETFQIQEIGQYQQPSKVPRMPKFISGVINLRGTVVPIIDLNERFGLGVTDISENTKIIVSKVNTNFVGFIVNDVMEIISLSDNDYERPPEIISREGNSYLIGIGKSEDKLISIIDLSAVLDPNEIKKIDNKKLESKVEKNNVEG